MSFELQVVIVALLIGVIPGAIASRKGHSFVGFWLMGAMFFIVALPWAILIGPSETRFRRCPHCREWISREATVCSHCAREVQALAAIPVPVAMSERAERVAIVGLWVLCAAVAAILVGVIMAMA